MAVAAYRTCHQFHEQYSWLSVAAWRHGEMGALVYFAGKMTTSFDGQAVSCSCKLLQLRLLR